MLLLQTVDTPFLRAHPSSAVGDAKILDGSMGCVGDVPRLIIPIDRSLCSLDTLDVACPYYRRLIGLEGSRSLLEGMR